MSDEPTRAASRMFQIHETDLADLERLIPKLAESIALVADPTERTILRRCQTILSQVRWGYGPATEVERIEP